MPEEKILVVDDEIEARKLLKESLKDYDILLAEDGIQALEILKQTKDIDLILLDIRLPDIDGIEVLKRIKEFNSFLPVVMVSALTDAPIIVEAMKRGATDFITKPLDKQLLKLSVKNILEKESLKAELALLSSTPERIIGTSKEMQGVKKQIIKASSSLSDVLLVGETGVGKELIAEAIHLNSRRKAGPFLKLNCASVPENLIESELFGYKKGAFTGATQDKEGLVEAADKGTLFLDEIADMPPSMQAKLLRFLEDGSFMRLGDTKERKSDVRVIASTNKDIREEIKKKRFREDLYYRIGVIIVKIPALRERREDIPELLNFYLGFFAKKEGKPPVRLSEEAVEFLKEHPWPGNIRELKNFTERITALCNTKEVTVGMLPYYMEEEKRDIIPLRGAKEKFEKEYLLQALRTCKNRIEETAKLLGIDRTSLFRKLRKYGIEVRREE